MTQIFEMLVTETFLTRALIVGVLISVCSALLGVSLVLKRFSMIGDGLSHVGFGAMAIASAANIAPLWLALPVVIVSAFLLLRMNERGKIKGDAAIALLSTGALAIGIMVTSMTTGMNVDIYNYMFGSILTMKQSGIVITSVLATVVISLFVIFYDEIFAVTFDESFAKATGTKVSVYNMLIASLTAVTIVIGMRMMGALLISSLIIFPSVTSMRLAKSYKKVIISSCLISVFCFISGLIFSVKHSAPTGASVVCINLFVFVLFSILRRIADTTVHKKYTKSILSALTLAVFIFSFLFAFSVGDFTVHNQTKDRISVVTTGFASYDFVRQIAGEKAEVVMLLNPGEESHTFEPTPADVKLINDCDFFIYGGGESEKWVETIINSADSTVRYLKMMDVVTLCESEHVHEEDHFHNESDIYDEHVWTSPENAVLICEAVFDKLVEADNVNAEFYRENKTVYTAKLKKLSEDIKNSVETSEKKEIYVGDRFPMLYFCNEYGIEYHAAFPGCSAQVEANPTIISEIIYEMKNNGADVVFKVDLSSGVVAETISEETGADVETLYSCHIVSADDFANGETYLSLMQKNLEVLKKALN